MIDYGKLDKEVDAAADEIWDLGRSVWDFAELGFTETRSSAYVSAMLEKHGFTIGDRGIGGLDTSWIATWGSGTPTIGILVEYDALPGLGNDTQPTKTPAPSGNTNGHGCGHNLICSTSIGAAVALKTYMEKESLSGALKVFGCPAEEKMTGRNYMAQAGAFEGLDVAREDFKKQTKGKRYTSLNELPKSPGGELLPDDRHHYECCIHGALAHFGIEAPVS